MKPNFMIILISLFFISCSLSSMLKRKNKNIDKDFKVTVVYRKCEGKSTECTPSFELSNKKYLDYIVDQGRKGYMVTRKTAVIYFARAFPDFLKKDEKKLFSFFKDFLDSQREEKPLTFCDLLERLPAFINQFEGNKFEVYYDSKAGRKEFYHCEDLEAQSQCPCNCDKLNGEIEGIKKEIGEKNKKEGEEKSNVENKNKALEKSNSELEDENEKLNKGLEGGRKQKDELKNKKMDLENEKDDLNQKIKDTENEPNKNCCKEYESEKENQINYEEQNKGLEERENEIEGNINRIKADEKEKDKCCDTEENLKNKKNELSEQNQKLKNDLSKANDRNQDLKKQKETEEECEDELIKLKLILEKNEHKKIYLTKDTIPDCDEDCCEKFKIKTQSDPIKESHAIRPIGKVRIIKGIQEKRTLYLMDYEYMGNENCQIKIKIQPIKSNKGGMNLGMNKGYRPDYVRLIYARADALTYTYCVNKRPDTPKLNGFKSRFTFANGSKKIINKRGYYESPIEMEMDVYDDDIVDLIYEQFN
ncbi:MAG: hypothetical protein MJ252_21530, partial [archaeon]|nr:hypothetical protein [archaeon]